MTLEQDALCRITIGLSADGACDDALVAVRSFLAEPGFPDDDAVPRAWLRAGLATYYPVREPYYCCPESRLLLVSARVLLSRPDLRDEALDHAWVMSMLLERRLPNGLHILREWPRRGPPLHHLPSQTKLAHVTYLRRLTRAIARIWVVRTHLASDGLLLVRACVPERA